MGRSGNTLSSTASQTARRGFLRIGYLVAGCDIRLVWSHLSCAIRAMPGCDPDRLRIATAHSPNGCGLSHSWVATYGASPVPRSIHMRLVAGLDTGWLALCYGTPCGDQRLQITPYRVHTTRNPAPSPVRIIATRSRLSTLRPEPSHADQDQDSVGHGDGCQSQQADCD